MKKRQRAVFGALLARGSSSNRLSRLTKADNGSSLMPLPV